MYIKPDGKPKIKPFLSHVGNAEVEGDINTDKKIKQLKTPKESVKKLQKKLDEIFSVYIRRRYADSNGMVTCFTSGKRLHWKEAHCGHFISRRHLGTRWDEINCQVQSVAENIFNQGNAPEFARRIEEKYGKSALEMLFIKKNNKVKLSPFEYGLLIAEYKEKVSKL
jgi:hypothetical protein